MKKKIYIVKFMSVNFVINGRPFMHMVAVQYTNNSISGHNQWAYKRDVLATLIEISRGG